MALSFNKDGDYFRQIIGLLLPFLAAGLQWLFWPYLPSVIWLFFYPAVFFSALIAGTRIGIIATLITVLLVIFFLYLRNFPLLYMKKNT